MSKQVFVSGIQNGSTLHQVAQIAVFDADGRQVGKELPMDKPESIGPYFDALAAKAYPLAVGKRTKPLQR